MQAGPPDFPAVHGGDDLLDRRRMTQAASCCHKEFFRRYTFTCIRPRSRMRILLRNLGCGECLLPTDPRRSRSGISLARCWTSTVMYTLHTWRGDKGQGAFIVCHRKKKNPVDDRALQRACYAVQSSSREYCAFRRMISVSYRGVLDSRTFVNI